MFVVLIGIFMISNVFALGITPARTTFDFSPGMSQTVDFSVLNSEHKELNLVIYAKGELADYISLKENSAVLSAQQESRQFSYTLDLPNDLSPGLHTADVIALSLPGKSPSSEAYVGAAIAVVTQVYVYVPYPYKYAEADLNIVNAEVGGEAVLIMPVVNR